MTRQTVIAWRARYETGGIDALADLPRSVQGCRSLDEEPLANLEIETTWQLAEQAVHDRNARTPNSLAGLPGLSSWAYVTTPDLLLAEGRACCSRPGWC